MGVHKYLIYNTSVLLSEKEEKYKSRYLLQDQGHCCSHFWCPSSYDLPSFEFWSPFAFNDGETKTRTDVVTLQRHDIETSRRFRLLTFIIVDPTLRRWDVATFQPALCTSTLRSKMLPKTPVPPAVHTHYENQMSGYNNT